MVLNVSCLHYFNCYLLPTVVDPIGCGLSVIPNNINLCNKYSLGCCSFGKLENNDLDICFRLSREKSSLCSPPPSNLSKDDSSL